MPQMQGHHEFNPKEASTLVIAEETPSFYNQRKPPETGMTNDRLAQMLLLRQQNDEAASEIPSM